MPEDQPITVVETPEFLNATRKWMDDQERSELVNFLAYHPTAGVLIPGSGGVRKLRWALEGRGKRGGARIIYFYCNRDIPVYLLTAFAKNQREDLRSSEIKALKKLTELIVDANRRRRSES